MTRSSLSRSRFIRRLVLCRLDSRSVLVGLVADDLQGLDEAERGSQPPQGRVLVGIDLGHGPGRLPPWLVAAGPKVQIHPAALQLELVDLALAVVHAPGLERQHLQVPGEVLQVSQQFSYGHATQGNGCPQSVRKRRPLG